MYENSPDEKFPTTKNGQSLLKMCEEKSTSKCFRVGF